MRGHQNTWRRVSQAQKSRYGIDEMVHVWLLEIEAGDADRCVGGSAQLYCACTWFFLTEKGSRQS